MAWPLPIKPATFKGWKSHLKVHILPKLQNVLLPDITNKTVRDFVPTLKLSPKSVRNVVQVIKMVKASAIDEDGNELYPTKWNHDFIDMPRVKPAGATSAVVHRTSGYIFTNSRGGFIHQSNFLRREFHPVLKAAEIPKAGFHGFRRNRNTFLRNVARCPDGLLKYWLGHADKSMSDLYDKVREDEKFRRGQAKKVGVGFVVPKSLKATKTKPDKFVVRRVVRDSGEILQK